ncbi:MAG: pyridoxal phosphate-dependent aminotransferase [Planctomycetota bacterium]|jgi:aspartate aminotransferase
MAAIPPSTRAQAITDSITLAISARASEMKAAGQDVISLGAGEPDFPTPGDVAEAGIEAIRSGRTRYTPARGLPEVREAATHWFKTQFGLEYAKENVMTTAGAKPALVMAMLAIINKGDRVLLPAPYWPSYPEMVKLAEGVPVDLPALPDKDFVCSAEQIDQAVAEHGAKGIVINFPNNPSGAVPSREEVAAIVDAAKRNDLWIISDEIYAQLIYDGLEHVSPANIPGGQERVILVNGATKSHSMTGWRVGFLAGPKEIVDAAGRIQSQAIGNPCTISQQAVMKVCYQNDLAEVRRRLESFDERRQFLMRTLNEIDGLALSLPKGAFYALVDVRKVCAARGIDDVEFAEKLLVDGLVATVPGSAFAIPGFIRLSYAASMQDLEGAVERIGRFVQA